MTTPLTYSGAPIPTGSEGGDVPAVMAAFGNAIDQDLNLKATSQANRDTLYANVEAGTIVTCALSSTTWIQWIKLTTPPTAAAWGVYSERQAPVTSGVFSPASNFSISSQWAQRINGMITVAGVASYSGSTVNAGTSSDLSPDVSVCTIQSTWLPPAGLLAVGIPLATPLSSVTGEGFINSSGVVTLLSLVPSGSLVSGFTVRFSATYPGA